MPELETVDLKDIEILSVGGPIRGEGSPPEGDFYTTDDLRAMAEAASELGAELDAPNKIGHSDAQALLFNSDLVPVTPGEMPRIGTLVNQRVSDDGQKLLTDITGVPKKVADVLTTAWPKRSIELSRITSQKSGKVYDWVVSGLSWLGAKLPAVQTLEDVVALYESDEGVELRRIVVYEVGSVVWNPGESFQALRDDVAEALNGPPTGGMNEPRFWVQDVDVDGSRALVGDYQGDTYTDAWVIPFTRGDDGTVSIAPSSDWTKAEQAWVETAKEFAAKVTPGSERPPADTRPVPTFTEDQRKTFAEATGLEQDKVTDEMLANAGVSETPPDPDPDPDPEPKPGDEDGDAARSLEQALQLAKDADDRSRKFESELGAERRRSFVEAAMKEGKIAPGQRETLEKLFDTDAESARKFVAEAPVNDELLRIYGSEELPEDEQEATDKAYAADASVRLGIPVEAIV